MKEFDSIVATSNAAIKLGISYGQYVALYGAVHEEDVEPVLPEDAKICPVCGKVFVGRKWNAVYCSIECQKKRANKDNQQKYRVEHRTHPFIRERVCDVCGKPFVAKSFNQKYCGHDCYEVANKECHRIARLRRKEAANGEK